MRLLSCAAFLFFAVGVSRVGAASSPPAGLPAEGAVAVSSDHVHEEMSPDRVQAWVSSGVAGVPSLVLALGKVDWEKFAEDDCGEDYTAGLLQITKDMAKRSSACARAFGEVMKATTTTTKERYGMLLGLAGMDRVPPVLYDGLLSCLSDTSSSNRMRASELLARGGFRQAAPVIKDAMKRESVASVKNRMAYHLYQLGDPEGDPQALRK